MTFNQEDSTITPVQCRMARAGLRLGVRELGKLADVSPNSVARFERGENMHRRTIKTIKEALEDAGAEFFINKAEHDAVAIRKINKP